MNPEMDLFAKGMQKHIETYGEEKLREANPDLPKKKTFRHGPAIAPFAYYVEIGVRTKQLEMDTIVEYRILGHNRKEAMDKARRKAIKDGWPIQGFIYNVTEQALM